MRTTPSPLAHPDTDPFLFRRPSAVQLLEIYYKSKTWANPDRLQHTHRTLPVHRVGTAAYGASSVPSWFGSGGAISHGGVGWRGRGEGIWTMRGLLAVMNDDAEEEEAAGG